MRKSVVTQELQNAFPERSKVRSDDQSVGHSILNVIGLSAEALFTELFRAYDNMYLTTANVGEIDLTYRVQLPESYDFDTDRPDSVQPVPVAPTVSGLFDGTWYEVNEVTTGAVKDFWYEAIPTRVTSSETATSVVNLLVDASSNEATVSGELELFTSNRVYVKVEGTQFFDVEAAALPRARIRITGITWKGTEETEDLIFLFNSTRPSNKIWSTITRVDFIDFPQEANIKIYAAPLNLSEYLDPYNDIQQQKDSRSNLPVFWRIGTTEQDISYLELSRYRMPLLTDLLQNQTDLIEVRRWELLDSEGAPITPIDIMPIPYSKRVWVVTSTDLYLYDLDMNLPDLQRLTRKTSGSNSKIELSNDYALRDEDVEVSIVLARPIKTVIKHRVSITYPDGQLLYLVGDDLLDPDDVSDSEDFWDFDVQDERQIRPSIVMTFEDLGEHLITLEVQYLDSTIDVDQRILTIDSKEPLFTSQLDTTVSGIAIDHLQNLILATTSGTALTIVPHYDIMLVDFNNKQLVFREEYEQVKVLL